MDDFSDISVEAMIEAAEREVKMRERVYPRRVADGKMTTAQAQRETRVMQAIAARLRREAPGLI